jgi:hypothetical protein
MWCPLYLINVVNGVYYYEWVDCTDTSNQTTGACNQPVTCGCDSGNGDCSPFAPGPPPNAPVKRSARTKAGTGPKAGGRKKAVADDPFIVKALDTSGLAAALPAGVPWTFGNATVNPDFDGDNAYHVVQLDGQARYVRVIKATIKPPANLFVASFKGKTPRLAPLAPVDLRVGQEAELPAGVKPRPMVPAGPTGDGPYYVRLRRSGPKADPTVFHVLLKK